MLADVLDLTSRRDVGLAEVLAGAPALTRVDRKYLVPLDAVQQVLDRLGPAWAVLALPPVPGGDPVRRTTHYRSTYVDGPDLETVRAHVQQRRRRWKARSRLYVEDGLCRTEVKAKDGRGRTVKTVVEADPAEHGRLTAEGRAFLVAVLAGHGIAVDAERLRPSVDVAYERTTLARLDDHPARMTLDWGVTARPLRVPGGTDDAVWVDREHVLVETKGDLRPGDADRLLTGLGHRPVSFSKYAAAASLLHPGIADNDVRALRGRVLHRGPAPAAPADLPAAAPIPLWSRSA